MLSQNIFSIVFILCFTLTAYVRSQTCESIYPSSPCSNNDACGCIPLALADSIGICGVTKINCARLSPCDADFGCPSTNQMCVSHSSCGSTPICYPLSMTDPRLCPPLTTTTTSFPFYTTEGITTNGFDDNSTAFYTTEGTGTVETTTNSFDDNSTAFYTTEGTGTFEATTNGFDDNSTAFYTTGANGTFETTTSDFDDNSTSTYPSNWTILRYSSALTTNTSMNSSNNKYYELYRIRVNTSGEYQIRSVSHMDTYGCIYEETDDIFNASNATSCNDDFNGNQFQLNVYLDSNVSYTLLFTTFGPNVTGPYTIEVYGENYLSEFYQIYVEEETTTATYPTNSTESEYITTSEPSVFTAYSSILSENSPKLSQFSRHYEAVQVRVNTSGQYTFRSYETLDGMGYLYHGYFNPSDDRQNLIAHDDQSGGNNQFSFTAYLEADVSYVLVFTTYGANIVGEFSVHVSGPASVLLFRSETFESTSIVAPFQSTTNTMNETESNSTDSSIITSHYSSVLTTDSTNFTRPLISNGNYYYEAIQINVYTPGFYIFSSGINDTNMFENTTNSSLSYNESSTDDFVRDSYGYLYENSFSLSSPTTNLIVYDDDGASMGQFKLTATLQPDRTYVLVFTTYGSDAIGSFSITAYGPYHVKFYRLNNI